MDSTTFCNSLLIQVHNCTNYSAHDLKEEIRRCKNLLLYDVFGNSFDLYGVDCLEFTDNFL
ncbi:hypothetical protein HZS_8176 [Henneguya salminicola]|nr:hypothetical protein HZS_8176 [Henneguya salminicola]